MGKINFAEILDVAKKASIKYAPEILTGLGITGLLTAIGLAVKVTPKALTLIDEAKKEKGEDLTKLETVKTVWKCYIPVAGAAVVSSACIIFASKESRRRNAALAAAYSLSESAITEYKDKVIETVGEKKEQDIQDAIAKDEIDKNPVVLKEVIETGDGKTLCYDPFGGRYFRSDIDFIKTAIVDINFLMINDTSAQLNDFYDKIHLNNSIAGEILGWDVNNGKLSLKASAQISESGEPCIVVKFNIPPTCDYEKY